MCELRFDIAPLSNTTIFVLNELRAASIDLVKVARDMIWNVMSKTEFNLHNVVGVVILIACLFILMWITIALHLSEVLMFTVNLLLLLVQRMCIWAMENPTRLVISALALIMMTLYSPPPPRIIQNTNE